MSISDSFKPIPNKLDKSGMKLALKSCQKCSVYFYRDSKKGFTLVEVVVVLLTFSIILAGAATFFSFSLKSASTVKNTTSVQSELRLMLMAIKQEVSIAESVLLLPSSDPLPVDFPKEEGMVFFHMIFGSGNECTLAVEVFGADGSSTTKEFEYINNFSLWFTKGKVSPLEESTVYVDLYVTGNENQLDVLIDDEIFIGNGSFADESETVGISMVVMPAKKYEPIPN